MLPVRRGFALLLSLLLVLLLTIFAYWMLLLAEKHYSASRMLYDSENARVTADTVAIRFVLQHNVEVPRFFIDPSNWNGLQLHPFVWNQYAISGNLAAPWSETGINLFQLQVEKNRSLANLELPVRQIRLEDFALFSDAPQQLTTSTLFHGYVFIRDGLNINQPVRFREVVHNDVFPSFHASYRKVNRLRLDFPFLSLPELSHSVNITDQAAPFWQTDHYELDLDRLTLNRTGEWWEIKYNGITIGLTKILILAFDRSVHVTQSYREISHLPGPEPSDTLFITSKEDVVLKGSIQSIQTNQREHPLVFYSEKLIHVSSAHSAVRIEACLLSSGQSSLSVEPGDLPLPAPDKDSWIHEINGSVFVVEPEKKVELLEGLESHQKLVWFRGSIGLKGTLFTSTEVKQLHFEACRRTHALIPSFPFVEIVEGKKKWR